MSKKNTWRTILEVIGAVISAVLGALGASSL
uniref:Smalltalk protein n=1 Tax=Dulem virus 262 TaxID=3145739 RepID=A0AAU8AXM4_9VIRU